MHRTLIPGDLDLNLHIQLTEVLGQYKYPFQIENYIPFSKIFLQLSLTNSFFDFDSLSCQTDRQTVFSPGWIEEEPTEDPDEDEEEE